MELYNKGGERYTRSYKDLEKIMSPAFTANCVLLSITYIRNIYKDIPIHQHDYDRAALIHKLRIREKHKSKIVPDPDYSLDSVTVMFTWCYKYSKIYSVDRREEAYERMLCHMYKFKAKSVLKLKPTDREYLFNLFFHKELGVVNEYYK